MPGLSATNITLETIASVYDGVPGTSSISLSNYYRVSSTLLFTNNVDLYDEDRADGPPYDIHVRPEISTVPIITVSTTPVSAQLPISFSDFSNTNNKAPTYSKKFIVGIREGIKGAPDTYGYDLNLNILTGPFGSINNRYLSIPGVTATDNYYNHGINEITQNDTGTFRITMSNTNNGNTGWSNIQLFDNGGTKQVSINRTDFGSFNTTIARAVWGENIGNSFLRTRSAGTTVTMEFN